MSGTENILAANGYGLAVTGMAIVFAALALISAGISALPRILARVNAVWPEPRAHAAQPPAAPAEENLSLVAAIAFAVQRSRSPE